MARCGYLDWPTDRANAEFIAAADPATVLALIAEVRRMRADWLREATSRDELLAEVEERREAERAFSAALGWGDGKTEPSATLSDLVDPLKAALSAASDHDECNVCCDLCGEMLAGTQCPTCYGSGCLPNDALVYADLAAKNEALSATVQRVRETAEHYDGLAYTDAAGAILRALDGGDH